MKIMKKHLSLLLAVSFLLGLVVVSTAITVSADTTLLVDLDLSTYVKNTSTEPNNTNDSIGGVTNNGTLASSTRVVMSSMTRYHNNDLSLNEMWNENGEKTYWFDYTNDNGNVADKNRFRMITDPAFESQANTFSFWIKYDPSANNAASRYRSILDYSVNGTRKFTLRTDTSSGGNFILTDGYSYSWRSVQSQANNTWVNLVVTNPEYVDGSKVMKTYLNGTLLGSTTVSETASVTDATFAIAGTNPSNSNGLYYPLSMSFGEIKVYNGELSQSEIADLYSDNAYKFVEGEEPSGNSDIEGYTFSDSTVEYDGESHNILVVAGQDATEDVEVAYTCNGEPFSGATEAGTYEITAKLTKEGYKPLELTATLTIRKTVPYGRKLIDLDFSTYVKDDSSTDPDTVQGNVGEVTNYGDLADSTILKFKSQHSKWVAYDLELDSFTNMAGSPTYYLHETTAADNLNDRNRYKAITEQALEIQANTITFWANWHVQERNSVQWNLLDYYANYGGTDKHLFTLEQAGRGAGKFVLTGRGETPSYGDIYDIAADKWAQYVITNPEYELNAETGKYEKTMKVFVNGVLKGQRVVQKPEGALGDVKIGFLGEITSTSGKNWPQSASIADVQVYSGAFTDAEISSLYLNSVHRFMPGLTVKNSSDEVITDISSIAANDTINVCYDISLAGIQLFAAAYSADGTLLGVNTVAANGEGTLSLSVPAEASKVQVFTWQNDGTSFNPIFDAKTLNR